MKREFLSLNQDHMRDHLWIKEILRMILLRFANQHPNDNS